MTAQHNITADELRQFIERYESLEATRRDLGDDQKDVLQEAKSRGYDPKVLKRVVALRRRKPDEVAEEEAIEGVYRSALGMLA